MFLEYVSQILPRVRGLDARDHERVLLAGPLVAELTSSVGTRRCRSDRLPIRRTTSGMSARTCSTSGGECGQR